MDAKIKVLNLYACLGGNRFKWDEVTNIEVTAIELDPELARMYKERFPNDTVIVTDAHEYLLNNYMNFDFIWSSPPCPSHSRMKLNQGKGTGNHTPCFPDMKLYEEIIFLENYFSGKYCIENNIEIDIPYYEPLIPAQKRDRHLYWTNFNLPNILSTRKGVSMDCKDEINKWCKFHDYDFWKYKGEQRRDKVARNLVDYEAGKTIFATALGIMLKSKTEQFDLFQ